MSTFISVKTSSSLTPPSQRTLPVPMPSKTLKQLSPARNTTRLWRPFVQVAIQRLSHPQSGVGFVKDIYTNSWTREPCCKALGLPHGHAGAAPAQIPIGRISTTASYPHKWSIGRTPGYNPRPVLRFLDFQDMTNNPFTRRRRWLSAGVETPPLSLTPSRGNRRANSRTSSSTI